MKYLLIATTLAITPASAASIDLGAMSFGDIEVHNPYDSTQLFHFSGWGNMAIPSGFNMSDATTWHLATMATYIITVSGGSWPGSMSICNDATNVPSAHPCGHSMMSGSGFVAIEPGHTTLHYSGRMENNPFGYLVSAVLNYDAQWQRSLPLPDDLVATPLPGALWLFASGLLLLGWRMLSGRI